MRFLLIMAGLVAGFFVGLHTVLQNGSLIRYLDTHPHPKRVPAVEYLVGTGYYIFGDLENSATYYQRIAERYPTSSLADDAYFAYLQSLDDMNIPRSKMGEYYQTYLDKFPAGKHVEVAGKRIEYARNSR